MRVGARRHADAVRAALVAELVEHRVGEREVVLLGRQLGVHVRRRERGQQRAARVRVAAEDDVDDLLAVEGVRERGAQLRIEQLLVLLLLRVRVEAEVADLRALAGHDLDVARLLELIGDRERHLVDVVDVVALERGEHGVGVREPRDADRVELRLRAVEARVAREDRRALLVELRDEEGAGADDREMRRRVVVLEALAVLARDRLPDVARQDEELLQLRQHVRDGLVVLDHERRRIGRRQLRGVREERRERRGGRLGVLEDRGCPSTRRRRPSAASRPTTCPA